MGKLIAPQGKAIGTAGLEPPARNRRKATVKKKEETPLRERCHERDYTLILDS